MSTVANAENKVSPETNNTTRGYLTPQVNILEVKDGYVLEAEMPGVDRSGLEILLEANELTLLGHRKTDVDNATLLYRESAARDFKRVFELAPTIDTTRINARIDNGVLRVELPIAEKVKPRKIAIAG